MDALEPRPMTASPIPGVQFDERITEYATRTALNTSMTAAAAGAAAAAAAAAATTMASSTSRGAAPPPPPPPLPRGSPSHSMCMPMRPAPPESRFSESRVFTTTETTSHTERVFEDQTVDTEVERVEYRTTYSDGRHAGADEKREDHHHHHQQQQQQQQQQQSQSQRRTYSDSRYGITSVGSPADNSSNRNNRSNRDRRDDRETRDSRDSRETRESSHRVKISSVHHCINEEEEEDERVVAVAVGGGGGGGGGSALDVRAARSSSRNQLEEVLRLTMQRSRNSRSGREDLDWQIRSATGMYLTQLRILQGEVRKIAKGAQHHRWRRWIIGGLMATIVPVMRAVFRRRADPDAGPCCNNNTEYAFQQSQSWITRIRESVQKHGQWASMAFFVFSLLFVFSNEVLFRVAKTVYKRVRKMAGRIEREGEVREGDLEVLEGWRWRVMLWG